MVRWAWHAVPIKHHKKVVDLSERLAIQVRYGYNAKSTTHS